MTPMSFPGSLSIGRDAVVGTILNSTSQNAGASASNVTCTIQQITTVNGNVVAGNPKTYQTDVDGIGVRFYITSGWNGSWEQAPTTSSFTVTSGSTAHYVRADLVVTGPISGGTITILPSMTISFTGPCINTLTVTETLVTGTMVTGQACSVTTPAVTVTMQKVAPSDLPSVGATAGNTAFSLGLNCAAGAKVNVTLTDALNPANQSNILTIGGDSAASGVGLRVLFGSSPVSYGPASPLAGTSNQWSVGTASGGAMTVPLIAQYVRTAATLQMGRVSGKALFTMSYQ
ncbi:fimbrial protein [Caballeronia sp. TF1N1]|uniref:fimbrial protein n=1 Tax=Caballeronia sp. TF1N1 TaxID=2878153 RepID=UPI001FD347B1|nr:fimbrial protein [Caballeronia sp. TF1N1]